MHIKTSVEKASKGGAKAPDGHVALPSAFRSKRRRRVSKLKRLLPCYKRNGERIEFNYPTNKSVPFSQPLPYSFPVGSKLVIRGKPFKGSIDRFQMDLNCGTRGHKAIHLNPRFGGAGVFVRNWRSQHGWVTADEDRRGRWLFAPGVQFQLKVKCKEDGFAIYVNGESVGPYKHRYSPKDITGLSFAGDVTISKVIYESSSIEDAVEMDLKGKAIPFTLPLQNGFRVGSELIVIGTPFADKPDRFHVNFDCGEEGRKALHLNPRFPHNVFVRNWRHEKGWNYDEEDRRGPFTFAPGKEFEVKVKCKDEGFKIKVNGESVGDYQHRLNPADITSLSFAGEVAISQVVYSPAPYTDDPYSMVNGLPRVAKPDWVPTTTPRYEQQLVGHFQSSLKQLY